MYYTGPAPDTKVYATIPAGTVEYDKEIEVGYDDEF